VFNRKQAAEVPERGVPVLCKFFQEDGVWNAHAEHLPVAVFGNTLEEAQKNLGDAIVTYMQSLAEVGRIQEVITMLIRRAEDQMLVQEIHADSFIGKLLVDRELVCA
jgi:predicted RNase H-like HicB family nuclease